MIPYSILVVKDILGYVIRNCDLNLVLTFIINDVAVFTFSNRNLFRNGESIVFALASIGLVTLEKDLKILLQRV